MVTNKLDQTLDPPAALSRPCFTLQLGPLPLQKTISRGESTGEQIGKSNREQKGERTPKKKAEKQREKKQRRKAQKQEKKRQSRMNGNWEKKEPRQRP